ncbi:MAG: TRAP transporter small permease [Fretibacterium sp.]|nr:TRAP transporter small permease [Fretibacterium sp.]
MSNNTNSSVPHPAGDGFLQRASQYVNTFCEMALFVTMVIMTIVTILQIVFRFWFRALTWSEELTCFLLVAATFLGTAVAFKRGAHIAVTFLLNLLPTSLKRLLLLGIDAVGIIFFVVLTVYGGVLCVQESTQMATAIAISMSWVYLIFPLTGSVCILHLLAHCQEVLRGNV